MDPLGQHHRRKHQNKYDRQKHIQQERLGKYTRDPRYNKCAALCPVCKLKINLFYQLAHIIKVICGIRFLALQPIRRQPGKNLLRGSRISGIVNLIPFSDDNIGRFIRRFFI